jgi:hypothetical protein
LLGSGLLGTSTAQAESEAIPLFQPQANGLALVVIRSKMRGWRRVAMLQEHWFYCSRVSRDLYAVPAGFVTDFASVPGFAKAFVPEFGRWAEAAVVHDWLYAIGADGQRREADRVFREALADQSVDPTRQSLMHLAVRVGGGGAYKRAGERRPEEWTANFVDRLGEPLPKAPLAQPTDPVWRRDFDCDRLEEPGEVEALRDAHDEQHAIEAGR